MRCPLCEFEGERGAVHAHLVDAHREAVELWTDAASGKMRYRVACPECGSSHEATVKPRSHDRGFLDTFSREIRLVAFDMLLNHVEAEHLEKAPRPARDEDPARAYAALPAAGPGGGRGRPGAGGIPLPPGMDNPDLPPWAQALEKARPGRPDEAGGEP